VSPTIDQQQTEGKESGGTRARSKFVRKKQNKRKGGITAPEQFLEGGSTCYGDGRQNLIRSFSLGSGAGFQNAMPRSHGKGPLLRQRCAGRTVVPGKSGIENTVGAREWGAFGLLLDQLVTTRGKTSEEEPLPRKNPRRRVLARISRA